MSFFQAQVYRKDKLDKFTFLPWKTLLLKRPPYYNRLKRTPKQQLRLQRRQPLPDQGHKKAATARSLVPMVVVYGNTISWVNLHAHATLATIIRTPG